MSIELFHILKASNATMIIFDIIMNGMKRHEGHRINNGRNGLVKRKKFINNMNQKLYNNKTMMKPTEALTHLSSGWNTYVLLLWFQRTDT